MRRLIAIVSSVLLFGACGSAPSEPARVGHGTAPAKVVREPDVVEPLDVHNQKPMLRWMGQHIDNAVAGKRQRVRLPLVRRGKKVGADSPEFAIAAAPERGPFYWLAIDDLSGAGIPPGPWIGWVEGTFTGAERNYHSADAGGMDLQLPVFEVMKQSPRTEFEQAEVRSL